jgi:methionyl-tRNA synthetase
MIKNKWYVTTPIYYVTAKPHLGSLYSTLIADVSARWNKLKGKKVFFLTGTDEHGQKIAQAAAKAGMEPKQFVDSFIDAYKKTWHDYQIQYDAFIRTTDPHHVRAVQEWIISLQKKGDIYKSLYQGWYCIHCETFLTEQDSGDQKNPPCPTCGRATQWLSEETYFFKLSAYQDKLLAFYEQNPDFIIPKERAAEVINFVKSGLKDLSISRTTISWGIPFPGDSKHVTYVWADALNNYITAIGWPDKKKEFDFWWPADVHVMGKDIIRFHAIYWPAFLMASDLALPKHLLVHGWIKMGDQKMSKSLGNVVDPMELLDAYGADPVRYYLMRQMAITHDGHFSIADLEQRITSDLANDLGNLLNRLVALAQKHEITQLTPAHAWAKEALELRDQCLDAVQNYTILMDDFLFHQALSVLWKFINQVNGYFHAQEPWKLVNLNKDLFMQVLSATAHGLRAIALLLWPVMPSKMEELLSSLGITFKLDTNNLAVLNADVWKETFMIKKIDTLFEKPESQKAENQPEQASPQESDLIDITDFAKVKLHVGTIIECHEVPNSDKLLRMIVDFGPLGKRQILAGMRKYYQADQLLGKQAVFVLNLKPRKMLGLESQGMMLTTANEQGQLRIITPSEKAPAGSPLQ